MQEKAGRTQRDRKSYVRAEELNSRLLNRETKTNRASRATTLSRATNNEPCEINVAPQAD